MMALVCISVCASVLSKSMYVCTQYRTLISHSWGGDKEVCSKGLQATSEAGNSAVIQSVD